MYIIRGSGFKFLNGGGYVNQCRPQFLKALSALAIELQEVTQLIWRLVDLYALKTGV